MHWWWVFVPPTASDTRCQLVPCSRSAFFSSSVSSSVQRSEDGLGDASPLFSSDGLMRREIRLKQAEHALVTPGGISATPDSQVRFNLLGYLLVSTLTKEIYLRNSAIMGSRCSAESSAHLGGKGRTRLTRPLALGQDGSGQCT